MRAIFGNRGMKMATNRSVEIEAEKPEQVERFAKAMWERLNPNGMAWDKLVGTWTEVSDEYREHAKAILEAVGWRISSSRE